MRLALYTGLILAGGFTCLTPALAADPTGDWRVADAVANIRVAQCNGSMWGAVSWEKEPGGRDEYNPDASKKTRPTLGMATLIDMKKKPGADQWEGQVYNAKDGQLYSATITPVGTDQLEIKGCVMGFLCGGETWTPRWPAYSLEHRQCHGQGRAEVHRRGAEGPGNDGRYSGAACAGSPEGRRHCQTWSEGRRRPGRRHLPTP
ncbi:uncharacterized protein (DUF2147 family) [Bradyrhizobium sp. LM6.9]